MQKSATFTKDVANVCSIAFLVPKLQFILFYIFSLHHILAYRAGGKAPFESEEGR